MNRIRQITKKSLTIFSYLFCQTIFAQVYHFEQYNIHNGLGQSQVTDLVEDQFGYMWFSTQGGGISRFDGKTFKTYRKEDGLPANNIFCLDFDTQDRLLIGSFRGFSIFDGKSFKYITSKKQLPKNVRFVFSDSQKNIYAVFEKNGIGKFENDALKTISKNDTTKPMITHAKVGSHGLVFVATKDGKILKLIDNQLVKVLNFPKEYYLSDFMIDKNDNIWLGTSFGTFKIKVDNFESNPKNWQNIGDFTPFCINETTKGDIWFGMIEGAIRITKDGKQTIFKAQNGLTNAKIIKIYEDKSGVIWFAADGEGVYKFTDSPFTAVNHQFGLPNNSIGTLQVDAEGKVWLGTFSEGLYVWDGQQISKSYTEKNGLLSNIVTSSAIDKKGNKWFGNGSYGLVRIDKNGKSTLFSSDKFGGKSIHSIVAGENNDIWLSTWGGLILFDGKKYINFSTKFDLHNSRIGQLLKIGENTFIAFANSNAYLVKDYQITTFKELGSWENSRIICTFFHKKTNSVFWGDMEEGVFSYNLSTKIKKHFSTKDGLSSNLIYNLIFDAKDNLWVGSEKGLDKIKFDKNLIIKDIRYYGKGEGFSAVETNAMTTALDKDGKHWIGTIGGAFLYHPEKDLEDTKPLKTQLTEVKLQFDTTKLDNYASSTDKWHRTFENLTLPYNKNSLTFSYIGIYHKNPESIIYQYKLDGFDKNWSIPTTKTEINYTNLPDGEYTFCVRASNNCGQWSNDVLKYSFKIKPPIWKTWWFNLFAFIILLSGFFVSQRFYTNFQTQKILNYEKLKQEAESEIRKQVAQDFHDELGNRLAAITTQSNVLKMKLSKSDAENQKIVKEIEENARKLYTDTKDFIWAIDPESNRFNELVMHIRDFGEKLFQNTEMNFELLNEISEKHQNLVLPAGWSIQIIMIFKEAMTNTLKHSECKRVSFNYSFEADDTYFFSLQDDGIGFDLLKNDRTNKGISNMHRRATKLQSTLNIYAKQPTGTIVRISGKIPKSFHSV